MRSDIKKLKDPQLAKLRKLAFDESRPLADRRWAASRLSENGVEICSESIPFYATPREGREALLNAEGGCVGLSKGIKLYRRPKLREDIEKGNVLSYHSSSGKIFIPVWQFTPKGKVLRGLPAVLKVLNAMPGKDRLNPFVFFLQPDIMLGLRTPLAALRTGETKQVLAAAIEHVRF